jgi:phosphonate transport system substrate-binding protein
MWAELTRAVLLARGSHPQAWLQIVTRTLKRGSDAFTLMMTNTSHRMPVLAGGPLANRHVWRRIAAGALATLALGGAAAETIVVQAGDTFSAIAARFTGDARSWRKVFDVERSGIPDPNVLLVGQRLELVEAGGMRYLKLVGGAPVRIAAAAAPKAAPAAATPAPTPSPTNAPTPTPVPAPAPRVAAASPAAAPAAPSAPAEARDLVIGLLPNIAPTTLLTQYESLKRFLERSGEHKVRLVVPANFKAFFDATTAGEYDIAIGAPHLQRVAQLDKGLVPLGMYEPRIGALLVTTAERGVTSPREITGLPVAFANPQSLVAMYGQHWLRSLGLEPGRDYEIKGARSDMSAGRLMLTGEAVAGIMSNGEFRALPADESARLKVVEVFARIPNFILLAHPRLDRDRQARLRTQLRAFFADADDGAAFIRATGLSGIADTDEATLRELDPFNAATRRAMGVAAR